MRFVAMLLFSLLSCFGVARAASVGSDVYGLSFHTIDGAPLPLSQYKGKVILIVNTASKCGFTKQYAGLQKLYETYKDKGFVLIGVPSNDFAHQEPGSNTEIKKFCETNFNITFPLSAKEDVTGDDAHPFFKQARAEKGMLAGPKWNFYKYLISRDGHIVEWFASTTTPASGKLTKAIEKQLEKKS